jgi:hypothetical protein
VGLRSETSKSGTSVQNKEPNVIYYRTSGNIEDLIGRSQSRIDQRLKVITLVQHEHSLRLLGLLAALLRNSVWVGKVPLRRDDERILYLGEPSRIRKESRFKVASPVLDEMFMRGIYEDVTFQGHRVALFGRLKGDRVVEAVALNLEAVVDP